MITKQAAEKLAQDYYIVGQQLAIQEAGLVKIAGIKNNLKNISKEALKEYLALLGGAGGMLGGIEVINKLGLSGPGLGTLLMASPIVAGTTSGAHQLSRKGLNKLLKK